MHSVQTLRRGIYAKYNIIASLSSDLNTVLTLDNVNNHHNRRKAYVGKKI